MADVQEASEHHRRELEIVEAHKGVGTGKAIPCGGKATTPKPQS